MKRIDLPPVWLVLFIALAWAQARYLPMGLSLGSTWSKFLAGLLIGGGLLVIVLAALEFRRHKTTIIPHETPSALIRSGIYKRSRNPIYLGDAMILAGVILWVDAVLSLPLIPVFVWLIERRFIIPEENRMRREFRADFARFEREVRRWV